MATTYFETPTNSDLNLNTVSAPANSAKLLQTAPGSATAVTITIAASASSVFHYFIADAADPGSSGGSGARSYTVKANVTTANSNFTNGGLDLIRLNAAGVVQSSVLIAVSWTTTGVKSVTSAAADLGVFGATDRFAVRLRTSNGSSMASQSIVLEVGLANGNEEISAPWTISATPRSLPNTRAIDRLQHLITRATADCWRKRGGIFVPRLWTPADAALTG